MKINKTMKLFSTFNNNFKFDDKITLKSLLVYSSLWILGYFIGANHNKFNNSENKNKTVINYFDLDPQLKVAITEKAYFDIEWRLISTMNSNNNDNNNDNNDNNDISNKVN